MTKRLKTGIFHAVGVRLREVRRVANWAGLSALGARDEIVRIMLIFCV